eukprot:5576996-Amphidinium_carterae.1
MINNILAHKNNNMSNRYTITSIYKFNSLLTAIYNKDVFLGNCGSLVDEIRDDCQFCSISNAVGFLYTSSGMHASCQSQFPMSLLLIDEPLFGRVWHRRGFTWKMCRGGLVSNILTQNVAWTVQMPQ